MYVALQSRVRPLQAKLTEGFVNKKKPAENNELVELLEQSTGLL